MQALKQVAEFLASKTGLEVVIEPQKIKQNKPHLRLRWSQLRYVNSIFTLDLRCVLYAKGDGPSVFLSSILDAEKKLLALEKNRWTIELGMEKGYLSVDKNGSGDFRIPEDFNSDMVEYLSGYDIYVDLEEVK